MSDKRYYVKSYSRSSVSYGSIGDVSFMVWWYGIPSRSVPGLQRRSSIDAVETGNAAPG